jgi:hypothetical protein
MGMLRDVRWTIIKVNATVGGRVPVRTPTMMCQGDQLDVAAVG